MIIEQDTYVIFWKPFQDRYKDFMTLINGGMFIPKLLDNYWPFEKLIMN